ncbi:DUF4097 family beta strand repeat-containing protein [Flagellimonas meridianipacifica]|uniref:Putative adhesin n=1 Tax=Flagellimonas meridianipacifica TaxID=1080225 RepID=A0A2T0MJA6_9FLAO|nr:DUF4097 family beta strand repeat-containing protein [Allomuricauda pacifica]PRX57664.1 putative adhesin [Allomuricauda pacifica]
MKKIKYITMLFAFLAINGLIAQEDSIDLFSVPLSNPNNPGKLVVDQIAGSIKVEAYEGKEVVIKASFGSKKQHYKDDSKEKPGMKRISSTSLNIGAEEKDNVVRVINEQWNRITNLEIKVPRNFSLKLSTVNDGNIFVTGVNGEMEISNVNGEITLEGVSGSASTDTVNGDIKVNFKSITTDANMAFSSLNGDVDITFPSSLKADVKAKSDMGEIYTDFDMAVSANQPEVSDNRSSGTYKVKIEQWVRGKINGGGPEMLFKTFNGDVYIKSK